MKTAFASVFAVALVTSTAFSYGAAPERATAKEAEAMVKKGVAHIKANPRDKAMADISNKQGQFVDRDLYLTVYKLDGLNLAHGANEKFIGKNMIDLKDIDGKEYMRERLDTAKSKNTFWQDFKFVNPVNKKIEPKQMYCERADELVVCGGIYKPA
jgi:signal transduction histidine kinase